LFEKFTGWLSDVLCKEKYVLFTELRPTAGLSIFQVYQYFTIYRQYFL
jgi:hypothetical protein